MAAVHWGLECLRYEISKSGSLDDFPSKRIFDIILLPLFFFRGYISSSWSESSYGDASRSRTEKESSNS